MWIDGEIGNYMKKKEKNKYFFGTNKTQMNIEEYVSQINEISKYYFERCEKYKKRFYRCCFIRIFAAMMIPIISLASEISPSTIIVSVLSGIITLSESYVNVTQAYEKWTKYRATCNALRIESRLFAMKVGKYADEDVREKYFVEQCEKLMIEETNEWKEYINKAKEMK